MAKRLDRLEKFLASNPQAPKSTDKQGARETFIQPVQLPVMRQENKPHVQGNA